MRDDTKEQSFGLLTLPKPEHKDAHAYQTVAREGLWRSFLAYPYLLVLTPDVIYKHIQQVKKALLHFSNKPIDYSVRLLGVLAGAGIGYTLGLSTMLLTTLLPISLIWGGISLFNAYRKNDPALVQKGLLIPAVWIAAHFLPIINNLCSAIVCSNIIYNTVKAVNKAYIHQTTSNTDNAFIPYKSCNKHYTQKDTKTLTGLR